MQGPLAVEPENARAHRVVPQRVELTDLEERPVDHLQTVGPTRHEDLAEHVVEVVARVFGDLHATREHRHLGGRGEVRRPEDDGLEAIARRADLLDVDETPCRLDLRLDADATGPPDRLLDLSEQQVKRHHLRGVLDLRQHDLVEPVTGVLDDRDDVPIRPLGIPRVDPNADDRLAPFLVLDRVDDLLACRFLLQRRDGILQVKEDLVGAEAGRLAEHLLVRTWGGVTGPAGHVLRTFRHGRRG